MTETATKRRRGPVYWLGLGLMLAGLSVLAWVAWQYFGTNIVAKREHERLRTDIVQAWENEKDPKAIKGVGLLRVPRFGDDFEVPIIRGFDDATLAKGVAYYPDGAKPGKVGNMVLAGHRVTHGEPFRKFLELRAGDEVIVETRKAIFTYTLRGNGDDIEVDFRTSWPMWPVPDPEGASVEPTERLLTLLTCAELFHTDNRNVAIGELTNVEKKPQTVEG